MSEASSLFFKEVMNFVMEFMEEYRTQAACICYKNGFYFALLKKTDTPYKVKTLSYIVEQLNKGNNSSAIISANNYCTMTWSVLLLCSSESGNLDVDILAVPLNFYGESIV
jgi:hypothetical protein